ncbi:hypothetical protein IFR05_003739 [Cadophora sp. M221]|nr:hypothetical protein IFR05_003739 [Cadophora sp. M221]
MMFQIISTLLLILALFNLSTAFHYDVVCDHGIPAAKCVSTYGTYCSQHGVLLNQAPSGLDCTTNRSPKPQGGVYCYCKFHYVAVPKATAKFNPNEILQQRRELNERAAEAAASLATPTFDPNSILQWARDIIDSSTVKNDVRNEYQHFEAARQLPPGAISGASSILASLSSVLAKPLRTTAPATSTHLTSSTHSATTTATVTPVLPSKSGAAGRKAVGVMGMLGVVAVWFAVGL